MIKIGWRVVSPRYAVTKWRFFVPKCVDAKPGSLELFENV